MICETSVLANGTRIITRHRPGFQGAAVGVWLGNGARHQSLCQNGFAHLLEHMLLQSGGGDGGDTFALALERFGGRINADTGRELTAIHGLVPGAGAAVFFERLLAVLTGARFDSEALVRERAIVLREREAIAAAPELAIEEAALRLAWPDDALGWPILGSPEALAGVTPEALQDYLQQCLCTAPLWVFATGAIDHEAIVRACNPLGRLPRDPARSSGRPVFRAGHYRERRATLHSHLVWVLPVAPPKHPHYPALLIASYILGGGMASRLVLELRERLGLVYGVQTRLEFYSDTGLLLVQTRCTPSHSLTCRRAIEDVITRFLREGPEAHELELARSHLYAGLVLEEDDLELSMQRLAREAIYLGRHPGPDDYARALASVGPEEVRNALSAGWGSHLSLVWDPL